MRDADGSVVAQISKARAELAKELLTKGDPHLIGLSDVGDPLCSLSIAAALVVDLVFLR